MRRRVCFQRWERRGTLCHRAFLLVGCFFVVVVERLLHVALDQKHELSYAYASLLGSQAKFGALRSIHFTQTSLTTVGAVRANVDKI